MVLQVAVALLSSPRLALRITRVPETRTQRMMMRSF